jgi:hypothetical protein
MRPDVVNRTQNRNADNLLMAFLLRKKAENPQLTVKTSQVARGSW